MGDWQWETVNGKSESMDKFEEFQTIIGADGVKKVLQAAAIEAINSGDWNKVRAIADFAININMSGKRAPKENSHTQEDLLSQLDITLTDSD
jgi:hypothetical protein